MASISELQKSEKIFLSPSDICKIIGSDPQTIRVTARQSPGALGFPVCIVGNRVKIPRLPFLQFVGASGQKKAVTNIDTNNMLP